MLFLFTRGVPTWAFFRSVLTKAETSALALFASTGLPLIVVITAIGVNEHRMKPQNAAALVAAGMLSVLICPIVGMRRLGRDMPPGVSSAIAEPK